VEHLETQIRVTTHYSRTRALDELKRNGNKKDGFNRIVFVLLHEMFAACIVSIAYALSPSPSQSNASQSQLNLSQSVKGAGHHVYADRPDLFHEIVNTVCDAADDDSE